MQRIQYTEDFAGERASFTVVQCFTVGQDEDAPLAFNVGTFFPSFFVSASKDSSLLLPAAATTASITVPRNAFFSSECTPAMATGKGRGVQCKRLQHDGCR